MSGAATVAGTWEAALPRLTPEDGLPPGRVYCVDTQAATLWLGTLGHGAWHLPRAALPAPRPHRVVIDHADVDAEGRLQLSWGAYAEDGAVPPGDIEVSASSRIRRRLRRPPRPD